MSLTSNQIDELRAYAKGRKGELAKLINDAADTIEVLSAKLHASQMERSSQYYHGGWIPCQECLPEENGLYLVTVNTPNRQVRIYEYAPWEMSEERKYWINDCDNHSHVFNHFVKAWMPLPEPYRGEGD